MAWGEFDGGGSSLRDAARDLLIESPTGEKRAPQNLREKGQAMGINTSPNTSPDRLAVAAQLLLTQLGPTGAAAGRGGALMSLLSGANKANQLRNTQWLRDRVGMSQLPNTDKRSVQDLLAALRQQVSVR